MAYVRRKPVTIKHVAAEAGVSFQTVSRVVNNEPNVSTKMTNKVNAAIDKLGYVPSIAARRLGGSKSYLILALNDRDMTLESWRRGDGGDWVNQMLLGGMTTCDQHGYRLIFELVNTHSDHVDREIMSALASLRPDGVILTQPHSDDDIILTLLVREGIPFARIGAVKAGPGFRIGIDEAKAAEVATRHLIDLGHERIGFIKGDETYSVSELRLAGFRSAMAAAALFAPELVQLGDFSFNSGVAATEALCSLARPVTAILASSDQMALGALAVAQERGMAVPDAMSIISFDDTPIVRFTTPPLTAIAQPIAGLAAIAAELLIKENSNNKHPEMIVTLPFSLNVRQSTGHPLR